MTETNHNTEIEVVKTRLDGLETAVKDLAKSVKILIEQPRAIAFKEIGATVLVMLGIFYYVGIFLEDQHRKNQSVPNYRIEQIESKLDRLPAQLWALVPKQ